MPHDRFGRGINVGDVILAKPYNQKDKDGKSEQNPREFIGTVVEMHSQEQSCTGQMKYFGVDTDGCVEIKIMKDYFGAEDATLLQRYNGVAMIPTIGVDQAEEGADKTAETTVEKF